MYINYIYIYITKLFLFVRFFATIAWKIKALHVQNKKKEKSVSLLVFIFPLYFLSIVAFDFLQNITLQKPMFENPTLIVQFTYVYTFVSETKGNILGSKKFVSYIVHVLHITMTNHLIICVHSYYIAVLFFHLL